MKSHCNIKLFFSTFLLVMSNVSFSSGPFGLTVIPLSSNNNTVSGGNYSNEGTINSLQHEGSSGGIYSIFMIVDMSNPYMVCSHTITPADYDGNAIVDLSDFSEFAIHWLEGDCLPWNAWCGDTDLNNDNVVDINDLTELASSWLQ